MTILLLVGLVVGQSGLGLLPEEASGWSEPISVVALTMVAFFLGADPTGGNHAKHRRVMLTMSLSVVGGMTVIIWVAPAALDVAPGLALLLGAIATANAPAASADVVRQIRIENGFSETIAEIVAIDDVWGLMVFNICLAIVHQSKQWTGAVLSAAHDLGGAVLLGLVIGGLPAYLTGRLKRRLLHR